MPARPRLGRPAQTRRVLGSSARPAQRNTQPGTVKRRTGTISRQGTTESSSLRMLLPGRRSVLVDDFRVYFTSGTFPAGKSCFAAVRRPPKAELSAVPGAGVAADQAGTAATARQGWMPNNEFDLASLRSGGACAGRSPRLPAAELQPGYRDPSKLSQGFPQVARCLSGAITRVCADQRGRPTGESVPPVPGFGGRQAVRSDGGFPAAQPRSLAGWRCCCGTRACRGADSGRDVVGLSVGWRTGSGLRCPVLHQWSSGAVDGVLVR